MNDLILHHYDFSNFAEKARLMLGFKGLAWRSVEQPPILPKPELTPLTGGYRRIPILQDGRRPVVRHPPDRPRARAARARTHLLSRRRRAAHAEAIAWWAEHQFMRPSALFVSGINADHMPGGLHEDRARLHGLPPPSIEAVRKAADPQPPSRAAADPVAGRHAAGRAALSAGRASPASPISPPITSSGSSRPPHRLPRRARSLSAAARLARPHGRDRPRHSAPRSIPDEALAAARAADAGDAARTSDPQDGDPRPGERARVRPTDNAKDWIEGEVIFVDTDEIALLRRDPEVGEVAVHFPRLGYDWRRA